MQTGIPRVSLHSTQAALAVMAQSGVFPQNNVPLAFKDRIRGWIVIVKRFKKARSLPRFWPYAAGTLISPLAPVGGHFLANYFKALSILISQLWPFPFRMTANNAEATSSIRREVNSHYMINVAKS